VQRLPNNYHSFPIVDHTGRLVGLCTFNDLKRALADGQKNRSLGEIANPNLVHAHPDHTLQAVMLKLLRKGISQLPVVSRKDTSRLLGIITMHDVAEALAKEDEGGTTQQSDGIEA
jgi:CIC family chloride channel protein